MLVELGWAIASKVPLSLATVCAIEGTMAIQILSYWISHPLHLHLLRGSSTAVATSWDVGLLEYVDDFVPVDTSEDAYLPRMSDHPVTRIHDSPNRAATKPPPLEDNTHPVRSLTPPDTRRDGNEALEGA